MQKGQVIHNLRSNVLTYLHGDPVISLAGWHGNDNGQPYHDYMWCGNTILNEGYRIMKGIRQ